VRHHANYRPDIDGPRAVAIILVVIFHAFPPWMPGGFVGVDIFLVISGSLISSESAGLLEDDIRSPPTLLFCGELD
jgi:peptidoglycan/LPS O-acetylase OafA/YrhL